MVTINTTRQLALVRSKIDQQQQIIALLESELQAVILGGSDATAYPTIEDLVDGIGEIYDANGNAGVVLDAIDNPTRVDMAAAFATGVENEFGGQLNNELDPTSIRHMLYQARAVLGELRIEEQQWNQEVSEEKNRRKDLGEFAKG